jgi:uncharacterized linocin/CFP29 family protein
MTNEPQVPWTEEQWARVNQVIQEEANRARVAASFLPLVGPLPGDTDFVRKEIIQYPPLASPPPASRVAVDDKNIWQLATLQVKVSVRGAQMADPEMTSALALFRRAANVLARLEDAVVFQGLSGPPVAPRGGIYGLQPIWEITGGEALTGLWDPNPAASGKPAPIPIPIGSSGSRGPSLVKAVSRAIGFLENKGQFGPFAVVLGQALFVTAQTPDSSGYVLPQDRIIPFLGGGSLLRSSTLLAGQGVVVALGGTPVELVVARDVSAQFLQVTEGPRFLFRVSEKMVLRIKEPDAIYMLQWA